MSPNPDLTPPGSSTYSSDTMYVGDGTWDTQRNTFLLPNLMGLNFDTMRYNGMGNRFREMTGYRPMIIAHGVIAAIVFLGLVPISVLLMRYYTQFNPFWAFKLHVWCQVLTLLLTTVVFVLGWFAVGPQRSLTNPHHGIGLAIYVMVITQVLWGWVIHKTEKGRRRFHVPLKIMLHRWLGRSLTILGIVQIPLGLTLYGSPESLFILYAIAGFLYLAIWFILSYLYDPEEHRLESDYDSRGSYISGPSVVEDRHQSHPGRAAAAGAAGAGLAALFRRRDRSRSRSRSRVDDDSQTSYIDEKYSDEPRRGGWGKRLLELGALVGGVGLAKRYFDKRRDRESDLESGRYRPAHGRSDDVTDVTEDSLSRVEEGRPPPSHRPLRDRPPSRPPSQSSMDYSSDYYTDYEDRGDRGGHGLRDTILGAGIFAGVRNLFKSRKEREEQRRVDEIRRHDVEEERLARANSKRKFTGDGSFPRRNRRASSYYTPTEATSTDITRPTHSHLQGESAVSDDPVVSGGVDQPLSDIPPVPPAHGETPVSYGDHHDHTIGSETEAELAGAASGLASSHHRRRRSSSRRRREDVASPPVSVKVKMHNDGRHVTLRRLTEEEAAASREARRRDRERRGSRRRHGSVSSLSGNEGGSDRWRRVEELERQQAEDIRREQETAASAAAGASTAHPAPSASIPPSTAAPPVHPSDIPVPPIPPSSLPYGAGSITSPGTWIGTEASGDYASNRRRRRAERAQARQARQHSVEFT
ncbi:hypothetical protein DTO207G8_375 [Paecilomyces variotii]|nr:hypothetical protein DTO032I3_4876 [Paecilomyces variotii]KAJ9245908.1 hypothetical protein DTO169E5_32 [Paecilomyces variotii]KAJ9260330.1 hypothetical protein DTO207G8_375 [Paecilomyces variotii]KAJ9277078.1 hypothetical protein DTO021D3_5975 [Paecilomyces variotii]KAJ9346348.1 hypothetical protein DTO027B6_1201 [Paecilomyces variotii]